MSRATSPHGTPSGIGYAMDPECFLEVGDIIVCRIQDVDILTIYVKSHSA
jgi:2-keto-4-pentenoate hydratase/2-oxohepta-3-ene-1,7-dioic acid hydratase in catechol pathway